ncbi:MAG: hypothetical protein HQM10_01050 [Candidatus Riflebacteria bacterium]|nr:hypothetical protein [Candidatus Riflebacteria bacterium]
MRKLVLICMVMCCNLLAGMQPLSIPGGPYVDVQLYNADGNGLVDDSEAIAEAIASASSGATIWFGDASRTYLVDRKFIIDKELHFIGNGATIKLIASSTLFNATSTYANYIFNVRRDNVTFEGLKFDGNSPNNWLETDGTIRFLPPGHYVGCIMVGDYPNGDVQSDINKVSISNCDFTDWPGEAVSTWRNTQHGYFTNALSISNCNFEKCQNVQVALSAAKDSIICNNHFKNAYFASFQIYNDCYDNLFANNSVVFSSSQISFALVDPSLIASGSLIWKGHVRFGKSAPGKSNSNSCIGNDINGTAVEFIGNTNNCVISNNTIASSEYVGIQYNSEGFGNRIFGNKVSDCADSGLYFDSLGTSPVYITDNVFSRNNNNIASYGGRLMQSNISILSDYLIFRNNVVQKGDNYYGLRIDKLGALPNTVIEDNDIKNSGTQMDFYNPYYAGNNLGAGLRSFSFVKNDLPEYQTLDALPNYSGFLIVQVASHAGLFVYDAASHTCNVLAATGNATNTDVLGHLCVYATPGNLQIRQNLGVGTQAIRLKFWNY